MSFEAQYPGICADCGARFQPGVEITYDLNGDITHAPACPIELRANKPACAKCNLIHNGECF